MARWNKTPSDMTEQAYLVAQGMSVSGAANFLAGGTDQLESNHATQIFGFQMQSFGIQSAGIAAREQLNWGTGSWNAPSAGSMWDIENRQVSLQVRSEAASFANAELQMDTRNQFAIDNENAQRRQTMAGRAYRSESVGFDRQTEMIGRDNTREGWQYQSQMNALNFSWNMEDIDENIRRSSGRDRSLLIKQRDRQTLSQNMELGETDRVRTAQETMWKREDERFTKQEEYIKLQQKMEDEAFKRGQSQRETMYKMDKDDLERRTREAKESNALQAEARELQRAFQVGELDRSKAALGIQISQAVAQEEYRKNTEVASRNMRDNAAYFNMMFANAAGIQKMADSLIKLGNIRFTATAVGGTLTIGSEVVPGVTPPPVPQPGERGMNRGGW
jgi:hypothetical protein